MSIGVVGPSAVVRCLEGRDSYARGGFVQDVVVLLSGTCWIWIKKGGESLVSPL